MKSAKAKVSLTHREQTAREICVRIFREEFYSPEFLQQHLDSSMPLLVPLLARYEQEIIAYLADRLLRKAAPCEDNKTLFHLPISETKLRLLFQENVEGWRDTD